MAAHSKLMIGIGIAIAGLGLIGAGAGATFTAQVSGTSQIRTGGIGLTLNDRSGSDLRLDVDGTDLGSHFAPITQDLRLRNTGTLEMASTFLDVTATGCDGGEAAPLAQALQVTFTDVSNGKQIYDGSLCSLSSVGDGAGKMKNKQGFVTSSAHDSVGAQLPVSLGVGKSVLYRIVLQPKDGLAGLPNDAQYTKTSVKLVFTGFDY